MGLIGEVRFTRIYEEHYAAIVAYSARRVNRAMAEDVANEVFVVLWRRIDQFDDESPLPWLYNVAYRTIANRRRGAQRKVRLSERLRGLGSNDAEGAEVVVVRREQDRVVLQAIAKLSPADQQVRRLAAWEELTASDIAKAVGCSVSAAEQRLQRAKKRLAKVRSPSLQFIVPLSASPQEGEGLT